jgi:tetratricopeptide (TPR) repeat protein
MRQRFTALALLVVLPALAGVSCGKVQAKMAMKDGNKNYKEENFKRAIDDYQRAVELDPNYAEAWFYLGSSHQALYRPGKDTPDNKEHLDKAIEAFRKSLEVNSGSSENLKKVRINTLGALVGIYSDEPYRNFETAYDFAQKLVEDNPNDIKNLYAMANLLEKFARVDQAEELYKKIREINPNDQKACEAVAAFYNKPLWEGRSKFDQAIEVLQHCASLNPSNAAGYQMVATFYWDKAYRDPMLTDEQKRQYADKGMEFVDKALSIKPDYFEAVIYKGLLFRVKATVEQNPRLRAQYLEQASLMQKQGLELKKQQQQAADAGASAAPTPTGGQ